VKDDKKIRTHSFFLKNDFFTADFGLPSSVFGLRDVIHCSLTKAGILQGRRLCVLPARQSDRRKLLSGQIANTSVLLCRYRPQAETIFINGQGFPAALKNNNQISCFFVLCQYK
jgi:hypothetical protein